MAGCKSYEKLVRPLLAVLSAVIVASCVTQEPQRVSAPFNPDELRQVFQTGSAEVTGQAFARQRGGGVVTAAGETVLILRQTPYTSERVQMALDGIPSEDGIDLFEYGRKTTADADGRFTFRDLPPGNYIIVTRVAWEVPSGRYLTNMEGGTITQNVSLGAGEKREIIMAR